MDEVRLIKRGDFSWSRLAGAPINMKYTVKTGNNRRWMYLNYFKGDILVS